MESAFKCQKCGTREVTLLLSLRVECWPRNRIDATPVMRLNEDMVNSHLDSDAEILCNNENCGHAEPFTFDGRVILEGQ